MRVVPAAAAAVALCLTIAPPAAAQDTLQPLQGGTARAVGMPLVYKPYLGVGTGMYDLSAPQLTSHVALGVYRDLMQADIGVLGVSLEYLAGVRRDTIEHGGRLMLEMRALGFAGGAEVRFPDARRSIVLAVTPPLRRGGILGAGTDLRFEWSLPVGGPAHGGALAAVLRVPLGQHLGTSRARVAHVDLQELPSPPVPFPGAGDTALAAALERVRTDALWLGRVIEPALGWGGRPAETATAALQPVVQRLAAGDSATGELLILAYHDDVARAFAAALAAYPPARGDSTAVAQAAAMARKFLLKYVLLPYNRYLGQRKRHDSARTLGLTARGEFDRWMIAQRMPAARQAALRYVFAALTEDVEAVRAELAAVRGDSRLVFLPLQLALRPEEYDEIEEIDSLISNAVQTHAFTHGNRIQYLQAERFQQLLIQSIHDAREYHVLWIHDIRGRNRESVLDRQSVVLAAGYLAALRERVEALDSTQQMPVYMIFLDQHYFEANGSRPLLSFLESPLSESVRFAGVTDSERVVLAACQDSLRRAVDSSATLRVLRVTWGEGWLRRLVGVRVSITNPGDPSFRSPVILPLIGAPDDLMRDHRKIILYDVSEEDPYRGMAMYTGMGIGEHYTGPMWEDRAISLQGPAALSLRDEAAQLLAAHGIRGNDLPWALRRRTMPTDYWARVNREADSLDAAGSVASRAIELHNPTGFAEKEIAVADATLFSLLPAGGVLKIPDSLWMNELYASLLAGAALRGVRVLMIMPGTGTAPSEAFPQMAMMHDLASRVVAAQAALAPALVRAGGQLHLGIYDPAEGMDNIAGRLGALRTRLGDTPWLRQLYGFPTQFYELLDQADALFPRPSRAASAMQGGDVTQPTLHFKGFLFIAGPPWRELLGDSAAAAGALLYYSQRWRQLLAGAAASEAEMTASMMDSGSTLINGILQQQETTEGRRCPSGKTQCGGGTWMFWLQVGSQNLDYRSMTMDGEAAVLVSNWTALLAVFDFIQLTGLTTWVDSQEQLDRLFVPPGGLKLRFARWIHLAL